MVSHHVAIAGGSGGLGRTLTSELCNDEDILVYVLGRKSRPPPYLASNARWLEAPYEDIDALSKLLDSNSIDTVISTLNPPVPEVHAAQDILILAAAQSKSVKRFIPSEWGIDFSSDDEHLPLSWKALKQSSLALLRQQQPSRLSYTVVYNGYFMDYFGMPHCESYMLPETPFLDIAARKAAIPGSGTEPVAWTYTKDVAKYVLGLVRSEAPWPAETVIVGDKLSFNEVLAIAEQVRGAKFDVVHDTLDDLRAGKISEIPAYSALRDVLPKEMLLEMMAAFGVAMATGVFDLKGDVLNDRYKSRGIQPVKMRDFIRMHWEGK